LGCNVIAQSCAMPDEAHKRADLPTWNGIIYTVVSPPIV
jgi:hypothetical protein